MAPEWVTASAADVPAGDGWLGAAERRVLAGLHVEKRRADWRLGRWTAKRAVAARCAIAAERLEILAAADGAPQVWLDGARLPLSLSLSHRAGRGLAVVAADPAVVGCDLELVEPRSGAFVREWLGDSERALLASCDGLEHARLANLLWAAKEAASKVRREGLRLDVRRSRVDLDATTTARAGGSLRGWQPLRVVWEEAEPTGGWWRQEPDWVMVIATAGEPAPEPPRAL